jgi:hypothetical protein
MDRPGICVICGLPIIAGQPRMYNHQTGQNAHTDCYGAREMKDHGGPNPQPAPTQPQQSPPARSAAQQGHDENMESAEATRRTLTLLMDAVYALATATTRTAELQAARNALMEKEVGK